MQLTKKTLIFSVLVILLSIPIVYLLSNYMIVGNFARLESERVNLSAEQVKNNLLGDLEVWSNTARDWAIWDDAYDYINGDNPQFEKSNLNSTAFIQNQVNYMVYFDKSGKVVSATGFDLKTKEPKTIPDDLYKTINNLKLTNLNDINESKMGLVALNQGLAFIAANPVMDSELKVGSVGTLVWVRELTSTENERLSNQAKFPVKIFFADSLKESLLTDEEKALLSYQNSYSKAISDDLIYGYAAIKDIEDNPIGLIRVERDRQIYRQGVVTSNYLAAILLITSLLATVVGFVFQKRFILNPLYKLTSEIVTVAKERNFNRRVSVVGNDELTTLSVEINKMLNSLDQLTTESQKASEQITMQLDQLQQKNSKLETTEKAMLNLLEDQRSLQNELVHQKDSVEKQVKERTDELEQKTKALKQAHEQVTSGWLLQQEEKSRLTASINSITMGYITTDQKKNIVLTNDVVNKILNKPGKINFEQLCQTFDSQINLSQVFESVLQTKKAVNIPQLVFNNIYYKVNVDPIITEQTGQVIGTVCLLEDITEAKLLQRTRDEFFSIASHELRTPLTAIKGNISLLQSYYPQLLQEPEVKEMVDDIHESSVRLIGIVNDFLDTSRLEQGRMMMKMDKFNLCEVIREVINESKALLEGKEVVLDFGAPSSDVWLVADRNRTKQIMFNLIGNAIKFTEKGNILVNIDQTNTQIKVNVTDTGNGIPIENQNLLFKKFQQASNNILTRETSRGTGLGLYISKLMAVAMQGDVVLVSSHINQGSVFALILPKSN